MAVSPGGSVSEPCVLEYDFNRQAVELGLHHILRLFPAHFFADEPMKIGDVLFPEGRVQAEHGIRVLHLFQTVHGSGPHPTGRGIAGLQVRKGLFQRLQPLKERFAKRIRDLRPAFDVIQVVVILDAFAQRLDFLLCLFPAQPFHFLVIGFGVLLKFHRGSLTNGAGHWLSGSSSDRSHAPRPSLSPKLGGED